MSTWSEAIDLLKEASYQLGVCNPYEAGNHKHKIDKFLAGIDPKVTVLPPATPTVGLNRKLSKSGKKAYNDFRKEQ